MENKGIIISGGTINSNNISVGDNSKIIVDRSSSKQNIDEHGNAITEELKNKPGDKPCVFISYNHQDKPIVERLRSKLNLFDIKVIIDSEMMKPGENISDFIEQSILNADVTLSIVSNNSLLSSWVGLETINTFYHEKSGNKKFIACYTDEDFFDNQFRVTATRKIDEKINELDRLILEYMSLKLDPTDLNDEKTRLFQLRNNLGDILKRLRNSLCIDINESKFEMNVERLISAIK
jgi:hypothetical protein